MHANQRHAPAPSAQAEESAPSTFKSGVRRVSVLPKPSVSMGEIPKPPLGAVSMGETPKPPQARFEKIRELGAGGMGEVSLAFDRDIGRLVAIKRLLPDLDEATTVRFVNEIRTLGQIEHPNIVPIYDVGVGDDGRFFFVMKHIDGETLLAVLAGLRSGDPDYLRRYPLDRRVAILVDVLRALSAAHAHGVLHRDIKPANVMIANDGHVFVMDWGIAKNLGERTETAHGTKAAPGERPEQGSLLGTLSYMSPEQAWGWNHLLDERSDLYTATVLLQELVTLRHYLGPKPSREMTLLAVISSEVSFAGLAAARSRDSEVPLALERIIARGLAKDPRDRYQSADEMIVDLTSLLQARAVLARWVPAMTGTLRGIKLALVAHVHLLLVTIAAFATRLRTSPAS